MTVVGRNKLQQIRDAAMEELLRLSNTVIQTAIENIDTPAKWFDKSAYLRGTEEITMNSIFASIDAGSQGTIALASLTQTSEYYLYTNYKAGTLSSRLRLASTQMEATVNGIMRTHIEAKTTWRRVQKSLNKVNASIGDVPKWLTELEQTALYYGGDRKAVKDALRKAKGQLKKLRPDRELRRSYQRVVEAVEVKNFDAKKLKSAMSNAVSQKAIYNNERIARTEIARAYNDAFHRRVEDDPTITAYRSILSSGHAETDECDYFAEVDAFGLGAGVYPAGQGYSIPYHSNCLCMMEPIIKHIDDKRRSRFSKERFSEGVSDFKPGIQKRIVAMGEPRKPHALPKKLVKYD